VGSGFDGGQYAHPQAIDSWNSDGNVVSMLTWFPAVVGYDSASAEVRAFNVTGYSTAPTGVTARAVAAVLAVPKPAPPVTLRPSSSSIMPGSIITSSPGFRRRSPTSIPAFTPVGLAPGRPFKAYGIGSAGRTGRRPVCRAYGLPSAGLDTHFYSASLDECTQTMVNFGDAWLRPGTWGFEASEVFQMDFAGPDYRSLPCR
jgi:hypothetical protein